jgi:predicted deacylase
MKLIKGSVRVIPRCNPQAFIALSRKNPQDNVDMNRIFPGSDSGTPTFATAHAIWQETSGFGTLIDIHCCGYYGLPYLLATFSDHPPILDLANSISFPYLIKSQGLRGQLFIEACRRGQRSLLIEIPNGPSNGCLNLAIGNLCIDSLLNFLRREGMLKGNYIHNPPEAFTVQTDVAVSESGLWLPEVALGNAAKKSQTLGHLNGKPVLSPVDGKVHLILPAAYVSEGREVAAIWS